MSFIVTQKIGQAGLYFAIRRAVLPVFVRTMMARARSSNAVFTDDAAIDSCVREGEKCVRDTGKKLSHVKRA